MHTRVSALVLTAAVLAAALPAAASLEPHAPRAAWMRSVDRTMGTRGEIYSEGVLRYGLTRSDLALSLQGRRIKPEAAMDGYVAFKQEPGSPALAVGEVVLTPAQVDTATTAFSSSGLHVTALHNHFIGESPAIYFLHFVGHGQVTQLASAVERAIKTVGIPRADNSQGSQSTPGLNRSAISKAIGETPRVMDGVLEYDADRTEHVTAGGADMPADMGPETEIHFQPDGTGKAIVVDEFAVTASEAPGIVAYLRSHGMHVNALHSHFLSASPQIFFLHAWAQGDALQLARVTKGALEKTNSK